MPQKKAEKERSMPDTFTLNNVEVHPGETKQIDISFARLPSRTQINIPITVFRAKKKGPCLLLMAGVHGDELNGIETIRRLLVQELIKPTHGTVIVIPVINVYSFLYGKRELPDGRDLNRCFPGSISGSLGSRLAYRIMHEIIPRIDYGIDFHTGGSYRSNFPQMRCSFKDEKSLDLAKAFSTRFIVNSPPRSGSLRKSAMSSGKKILVFEGGESMRYDNWSIQEGVNGTLRVMHRLGMRDDKPPPYFNTSVIHSSTWIRAKNSGLFHPIKKNGDAILKKETIGTITDPYGDFETKIKAPKDGFVIGINNSPLINQGDALYNVGY